MNECFPFIDNTVGKSVNANWTHTHTHPVFSVMVALVVVEPVLLLLLLLVAIVCVSHVHLHHNKLFYLALICVSLWWFMDWLWDLPLFIFFFCLLIFMRMSLASRWHPGHCSISVKLRFVFCPMSIYLLFEQNRGSSRTDTNCCTGFNECL